MFVVEALVSCLFEVVIDKLMVTPLLEYARRLKIDPTPLQDWKTTLLQIKSVLDDAEQRQIQDDAAVIGWLDDLKALACDIEDVLDEIETEAQRRSLGQGPQTSNSKVRKLMIPSFGHDNFNKKIGKKMNTITEQLNAIVKQKTVLGLKEGSLITGVGERMAPSVDRERQTTSLVAESEVYGRETDREKIIKFLLSVSDEVASTAPKIQVIAIVGMGGVGKTTLAQIIYNDKRVEANFQIRGWACVSDHFHMETITKQILESVSGRSSDSQSCLQLLQVSLEKELNGKKFFLVLDDVWTENPHTWSKLQAPLNGGAAGSVILVTTRSECVASVMRTTPHQPLSELNEEDSWSLFARIAFENITPNARQNLEPIGRRIIERCKGLPLAIKTLAGLLRSKQDDKAWEMMLNNEILRLPPRQSNILPVLRLSYHYLPSVLKQCFAYCSIFPKDYEFDKEELILLWAAQGFLGGGGLKREKTIKDVGERCFDELLSRSFFQQSGRNDLYFGMHDLIHDLAQFVSGKFCSRLEVGEQHKVSKRTQHVAYLSEELDVSTRFDPLHETDRLRTFLPVGMSSEYSYNLAGKVLRDLLPTFECLRVLSLSHYRITHLPDSFGNLKHLRYLNLSHTEIEKLPLSICMLLNLQSLVLSWCYKLTELPPEIGKLINLIHLDISNMKIQGMPAEIGTLVNLLHLDVSETKLEGMPIGINKLKDLRRLTTFVVGKHSDASIAELRDLSHLQGALSILNMQNVVNARDALEANLKEKKGLNELVLAWDLKNVADSDLNNQTQVLEKLQPHTRVTRLSIEHYSGTKFPKWLGDPSFMNLVFLILEDCRSCSSLPPLGQLQSLKDLMIGMMNEVKRIGAEFYGNDGCGLSSIKPFGSLEYLSFRGMLNWEEWVCCGVEFPCLKQLHIGYCPKLKGDIPKCLPQSTKIVIRNCRQLMCHLPVAPSIRELELCECNDVVIRSAGGLTSLVKLYVDNCPELKEIPSVLHNLISLKHLEIKCCKSLLSFSEMALPPMLEDLEIESCPILESLPEGMKQNNTSLQRLKISYCDSLRSLPKDINLLKNLSIYWCEKLELALGEDHMRHNHYASLTSLKMIGCCHSLVSFPLAFFTKLERLFIKGCRNLESLYVPDGLHLVDHLTSLQSLDIDDCPNFVSFPQGGLPTPNLTNLTIAHCDKLKSLPQGMHTLLTSLQELSIYSCLEIDSFPDGGLPANISKVCIWGCNKLVACRTEWDLHTLPCLRSLTIMQNKKEQGLEESFPGEERFLPFSLTHLRIGDLPSLKCLENKGLQHLNSLEISSFPNLKSLDNKTFQHLTSLETLEIGDCESLKYLPTQGLPSSLSRLQIVNCPLLQKRCTRNEGKEWSKISHIPCILFSKQSHWPASVIIIS